MQRLLLWCCLVVFLVTGCGGGNAMHGSSKAAESPAQQSAGYAPDSDGAPSGGSANVQSESAPRTASISPQMAPPSSTSSSHGGDHREASADRSSSAPVSPAPEPRQRPGLGTEWGESRTSRVHDVSFVRADNDRPFAVAALHYNDRAGVVALAAYHADRTPHFRDIPAGGGAISVSIRDGNGESLEAAHVGDRTYVMGTIGSRYTITLTNHTGHRFETVATVDGLDVINGQPGTPSNRGYVLMPFATLEIDGFRQSQDAVAAFRFARVADSYAAQTGTARNVGVIGVAFFAERGDTFTPYTDRELETRDTASPFPGADPRFAQPPRR